VIFHKDVLKTDYEHEAERIAAFIRQETLAQRREGAVIGLSGGVDSALAGELCVRALGREKVFGLILPEKDSHPTSKEYALKQARKMGIEAETVDITPALEGLGTYEKRDEKIREVFPEYSAQFKLKITLPSDLLAKDAFNFFTLTLDDGKGNTRTARLKKEALAGIVAATNTKQRTRMVHLYYHAEKMNYLVCGTTNRSEAVQGFFVKYGDGGVDIEPIVHLYKTQVYGLAEHLGVIPETLKRPASPDTYTFYVSDEEFFFRIPFRELDLLLFAWEYSVPIGDVSRVMGLNEDQVKRAFRDFSAKSRVSEHMRKMPATLPQEKG
jgi:NAD+ synthase